MTNCFYIGITEKTKKDTDDFYKNLTPSLPQAFVAQLHAH